MTAAARYAGSRVQRVEDARLLTGAGTFVDDVTRPGMLHACFVRSPHPRARILVDRRVGRAGAARRARRLHRRRPQRRRASRPGTPGPGTMVPDTPRPPLAEGEARFAGDPWPSSWRTAATWPRTPPSWSTWTTSRCPRSPTTRRARTIGGPRARGLPGQPRGRARRRARRDARRRLRRGRARGQRDDLGAGAGRRPDGDPRPGRGVVAGQRRADRLGGARRRRTRCGCSPPGCSASPSTASG